MVSTGAYLLSERVPLEKIVLTRNPRYWDNANTIIETATVLIINDENQALTRWVAGEIDQTDVPVGQFPSLLEQYPTETFSVPNPVFLSLQHQPDRHGRPGPAGRAGASGAGAGHRP